ncbi:autotransporter outer membrane beta-barrel domain-containing protein [Pseudomonas sp. AK106]
MTRRKGFGTEGWEFPVLMVFGMAVSHCAGAAILAPGTTGIVNAGSPVTFWRLDNATLLVNPGGATQGISAQAGSTVNLDGGSVSAIDPATQPNSSGVSLIVSNGLINDSTISSVNAVGLSVNRQISGAGGGSTASVTNSSISGIGRGVNVVGDSTATLINTQVTSSGSGPGGVIADGVGLTVIGGSLSLQGGAATGSNRGAVLTADNGGRITPSLSLDGATLTGTSGSAILIGTVVGTVTNATVTVQNGSTLNSGNGVILEVGQAATASRASNVNFVADDSRLVGDVNVIQGSLADVTLRNNAAFTGDMTHINSLNINAATMTGNVIALPGSPTAVVMANNSTFTGSMSDIASLDLSASTVTGNVTESSGSVARVSMTNGANLVGTLSNLGSLSLDGSTMTGDVVQDAVTPVSITLNNGSQLTGTVVQGQRMAVDGASTFNIVSDSSVGELTMAGGTVNMRAGGQGFRTLNASSLAGNGAFTMGTDLAGHLSDLVNVVGNADGAFVLRVQNTGVEPVQEDFAQKVVHSGGGSAAFSVLGGQVDVGTFVYRLEKRGNEWFLAQATTGGGEPPVGPGEGDGGEPPVGPGEGGGGEPPVGPGEGDGGEPPVGPGEGDGGEPPVGPGEGDGGVPPVGPGEPIISPSARAVIGVFSAAPTVWYGETATLRSRMGELRNGRDQGGVWARTYGNRYRVSATDQVNYTQTQSGISFGVDTPVSEVDGQWLVGVMGGYSESALDLQRGSDGRVQSYYLGLYSTWLSTSGYYVDALIKANRFQNKADVRMSDGEKSRGNYQNYGIGGSVEVGKHIKFAEDWFVEPFAQVSALWVQGEDYALDNGLEARSNKADSLVAKAGTHLGKNIPLTGGGFVQPYLKVAAAHEFARNNEVKVNRTTFSDDLSGSRGELGAGVALQLNNVLQLHADVDYSSGENIEQPWGMNVGLRYSW